MRPIKKRAIVSLQQESRSVKGKNMAIDIEAVRAQQRELNMVSDEISFVKRKLKRHQNLLDEAWKSTEVRGIDFAIEDIIRKLNRLAGDLEDLGHDVMVTGEEIRAEEEARAVEEAFTHAMD